MSRVAVLARDEGGLTARQLKNAAAEPSNRYNVRHVPTTATNSRARAAAGAVRSGEGRAIRTAPHRQCTNNHRRGFTSVGSATHTSYTENRSDAS